MKRLALVAILLACVSPALAAKKQAPPPPQQTEPLRQIPIVGTVVYGGLNYAGQLILSPLELITGPRRY